MLDRITRDVKRDAILSKILRKKRCVYGLTALCKRNINVVAVFHNFLPLELLHTVSPELHGGAYFISSQLHVTHDPLHGSALSIPLRRTMVY